MKFLTPEKLSYTDQQKIDRIHAAPGFGVYFTDHMAVIEWNKQIGWHDAKIVPYAPLQIDPAGAVFHYAQEIFEGMKAYRHCDGSVWMFRKEENAKRFANSAKRLALPQLPEEDFIQACELLVQTDARWVPSGEEQSLYLRPFMIASEKFLGVKPAREVTFVVIASPVGAYFEKGVEPVDIWVESELSRVSNGGTGEAKCGGNYAASLLGEVVANRNGCSQVLFVDNAQRKFVEELGGMNFFMVSADNQLITPQLNGNILPGVTRNSLLKVGKEMGLNVAERPVEISEVYAGLDSGEISELFACGTAAVITPISALKDKSGTHKPKTLQTKVTLELRNRLLDIQYGKVTDPYGWMSQVVTVEPGK